MNDSPNPNFPKRMDTYLTTEHFTLQGARSIVNSESASRASLYFTTLSAMIVAAAFVVQIPGMNLDRLLILFGLLAGPLIILLGLFTTIRLSILGMMDVTLIRAINRLRQFYAESTPQAADFLLFPPYDDMESAAIYAGWRYGDYLLTTANAVVLANSLVVTALVAMLTVDLATIKVGRFLPLGIGVFVAAYLVHVGAAILFAGPRRTTGVYSEIRFPAPASDDERSDT